jgi:hypothetical protein
LFAGDLNIAELGRIQKCASAIATLSKHMKWLKAQTFGREFEMVSMWYVNERIFGFDQRHDFVRR